MRRVTLFVLCVGAASCGSPTEPGELPSSPLITAGDGHGCVLDRAGRASCWGNNWAGQLGRGHFGARPGLDRVVGGLRFSTLDAGYARTCGVRVGGETYCWGADHADLAGQTSRWGVAEPSLIDGAPELVSVTVGSFHVCGVDGAGAAHCWGSGPLGVAGAGPTHTPIPVAGGLAFQKLSAGWRHVCGLGVGGEVYCWGDNGSGQLGDGTFGHAAEPKRADLPGPMVEVVAGDYHSCALDSDGVALCWGGNAAGQLGMGAWGPHQRLPVAVDSEARFTTLVAGSGHTCGLTASGEAWCWGSGNTGAVGDGGPVGDFRAVSRPVPVVGGLSFDRIAAGGYFNCGLASRFDGRERRVGRAPALHGYCWGRNDWGQLLNQGVTTSSQPVRSGVWP